MALVEGVAIGFSCYTDNSVYTVNLVVSDEVANDFRMRVLPLRTWRRPSTFIKRKVNGPNGMVRSTKAFR